MKQKHPLKRSLMILVILSCLGVTSAWGVPQLINYQGVLKDTNGDPVAGPVNMTFRIYSIDTGGIPLWTEDHTTVQLGNGIYNVLLGSNTTLPVTLFSGDNRWLEMTVNTEVLTPRTKITSAAFNFRSDNADYATTAGDASTASSVPWTGITSRPAGLDDGDDVGITAESDPTVPSSIKDGISWSEVSNRPSGLDDGDDVGITAESDPTVPSSIKDGISWYEVSNRPSGLDDGDDVGVTTESDPTVPNNIKDGISWSEISNIPPGFDDGIDNEGDSNFNAGQAVLLENQSYVLSINTGIGRRPKIVEITMFSGSRFSNAKWVDSNGDGLGIVTILHTDDNYDIKAVILENTDTIARMQSGVSDAYDFKIQTFNNSDRIELSTKEPPFGNPSIGSFIPMNWYAQ